MAEILTQPSGVTERTVEGKTRIEKVVIPEAVAEDLSRGTHRYLGVIHEHRPQIVVPLLRSGGLAHRAAEGLAARTGLQLNDPENAGQKKDPSAPAIARINVGREISGRLSETLDLLPAEYMDDSQREEYLRALAADEPVRELVGNLAERFGKVRERIRAANGKARVEIADDWGYELFTQGLTAPWIVLEALRQAGAVDIPDTTEALAGNNLLAARAGDYGMPDIVVPGVTIGRSVLLKDGAWIDKIRNTSVTGSHLLTESGLVGNLLKDMMKGGFEDETGRIVPLSQVEWELVQGRGAALLQADRAAQRRGARNPADILDERYERSDLLQLHQRTADALRTAVSPQI